MTDTETLRKLVSVKPLEWEECGEGVFEAVGFNTVYRIAFRPETGARWQGRRMGPWNTVESLDEAKDAAQADYEARILSRLTPSPEAQAEAVAVKPAEYFSEYVTEAAVAWCGEKDRETFPDDIEYFRRNWSSMPGLWPYVIRAAITHPPAPQPDLAQEQLKVMREALEIVAEGHPKDYTDNCDIAQKALDKCAALASVTAAQEGA